MNSTSTPQPRLPLGVGLLVFALVTAVQLLIVSRYGVNVPFFDEWTLPTLLTAYDNGQLDLAGLFAQHNEHRIFFARLVFLGSYLLLGEWNVVSYMAASAVVVGLTAGVWAYALTRLRFPLWAILLSCVPFVSPLQVENQTWGFQVQFYLVVLGVMLGLCAVALRKRIDWPLIAMAVGACFLATFSIASGLVSWPLIFACLLTRALLDAKSPPALLRDRGLIARLAVFCLAALVVVGGYFWGYTRPEHNDLYQARNLETVVAWLFNTLTYPLTQNFSAWTLALAAAQWVVIALGLAMYLRQRRHPEMAARLLLFGGLLLFVAGNAAATGYGRGTTLAIASRYATLFLLPFAPFVAVSVDLFDTLSRHVRPLAIGPLLLLVSTVSAVTLGQARGVGDGFTLLEDNWAVRVEAQRALVRYLREPDPQMIPGAALPFPSHDLLKSMVNSPDTRARLPASTLAASTRTGVELTGTAWQTGDIPGGGGLDAPLGWSSWSGNDTLTGRLVTQPFSVTREILVVPVAGFPNWNGNRLVLETTDEPHAWTVFQQDSPTYDWEAWRVDVSAFKGRSVRLVAVDGATGWGGWFAIGTPYQQNSNLALFAVVREKTVLILFVAAGLLAITAFLPPAMLRLLPAGSLLARTPFALSTLVAIMTATVAITVATITFQTPRLLAADRTPRLEAGANLFDYVANDEDALFTPRRTVLGLVAAQPGAIEPGVFRTGPGMCLIADARLDPRAPPDPAVDGVEAVIQLWQADQLREERSAPVLAGQLTSLVVPLEPDEPFSVRLELRPRSDAGFDWSIWRALRVVSCP